MRPCRFIEGRADTKDMLKSELEEQTRHAAEITAGASLTIVHRGGGTLPSSFSTSSSLSKKREKSNSTLLSSVQSFQESESDSLKKRKFKNSTREELEAPFYPDSSSLPISILTPSASISTTPSTISSLEQQFADVQSKRLKILEEDKRIDQRRELVFRIFMIFASKHSVEVTKFDKIQNLLNEHLLIDMSELNFSPHDPANKGNICYFMEAIVESNPDILQILIDSLKPGFQKNNAMSLITKLTQAPI